MAEKSLLDVAIAAGELRDASVSGKCGWFNETVEFNVSNFEVCATFFGGCEIYIESL